MFQKRKRVYGHLAVFFIRGLNGIVKAKVFKSSFPSGGIKVLHALYDIFETCLIKYEYDKYKSNFENESLFNYKILRL